MLESSTNTERRWARVGKVGAVVAILVGLVNLYTFLRPNAARLDCRCESTEVDLALPFSLVRPHLTKMRDSTRSYALKDRMRSSEIVVPSASDRVDIFASEIADTVDKAAAATTSTFDTKKAVVTCDLVNTGQREAKDVVFSLPFEIGPASIDGAPIPTQQISGKNLRLGAVKPGVAMHIVAWSYGYASAGFTPKHFLLTHEEGRADVKLPSSFYGSAATIGHFVEFITWSKLSLIWSVFVLGLLITAIINVGNQITVARVRAAERAAVQRYIRESTEKSDANGNAG